MGWNEVWTNRMQDIPERSQAKTLATFCDNIMIHIVASFVLFHFILFWILLNYLVRGSKRGTNSGVYVWKNKVRLKQNILQVIINYFNRDVKRFENWYRFVISASMLSVSYSLFHAVVCFRYDYHTYFKVV